jgi:signal transduction histidine kinase
MSSIPGSEPPAAVRPQMPDEKPKPEREETDERLRLERQAADAALHEERALQQTADEVVGVARERADAVLAQAREMADRDLQGTGERRIIALARADADETLSDERRAADDDLRGERREYARSLLARLPLERESTNESLLTERARSDADLAYRDDFLGIVSHDLNNLLGGIVMSADLISRNATVPGSGERIVRGANHIQLFSARMKRLIGDLVDVTSIAAGKLCMATAATEPRAIVEEAADTFRLFAVEKGLLLEAETIEAGTLVVCDRGRILQVLANLLANAVKFTPQGGTVRLCALRTVNEVCFSVSDTGPGIPEDRLEAVFERFWQAKCDRRGLGLGLYIAKSIVDAHGGRIWAESRPGAGSTFHFTLPLAIEATH